MFICCTLCLCCRSGEKAFKICIVGRVSHREKFSFSLGLGGIFFFFSFYIAPYIHGCFTSPVPLRTDMFSMIVEGPFTHECNKFSKYKVIL